MAIILDNLFDFPVSSKRKYIYCIVLLLSQLLDISSSAIWAKCHPKSSLNWPVTKILEMMKILNKAGWRICKLHNINLVSKWRNCLEKFLFMSYWTKIAQKKRNRLFFSLLECSQDPVIGVLTWYLLDFPSEFMTEATWTGKIGMLMNWM